MPANETRNKLDSNAKSASISLLNARLADSIDLALTVKQAHWNLKGREFIALHEFLDKLRDSVDGCADTMAERASAPGGTAQAVTQGTALPPYPTKLCAIEDHLRALADWVAAVTNSSWTKPLRGNSLN